MLYLHGIVPADAPATFNVAGVAPLIDRVWTCVRNGVAAVVSDTPLDSYDHLDRREALERLVAHQRVIETVQTYAPVLPVRFGTIMPDEAALGDLLAREASRFEETLRMLEGYTQMEVTVLWDLQAAFAEVQHDPEVARQQAALIALPEAERTPAAQAAFGAYVKAALDKHRAGYATPLGNALRASATACTIHPVVDDQMVLSAALLLSETEEDTLDSVLEHLDEAYDGALTFRCVGPMPPYAFATVEVEGVTSEAVNAARKLLGVSSEADLQSIKAAYRRQARRMHPDHAPSEDRADLDTLNHARRLLQAMAQHGGETRFLCHIDTSSLPLRAAA